MAKQRIDDLGNASGLLRDQILYEKSTIGQNGILGLVRDQLLFELNQGGSGGSSTLTSELVAAGATVGGIKSGDVFPSGTSLEDIIRAMLIVAVPPTYLPPGASLTASRGGSIEVGTSIDQVLTANYTQRNAGALTQIRFFRNGLLLNTQVASPAVFTDASYQVQPGNQSWNVLIDYAQGPVKNNNLGQPDPTGRIEAGSVASPNRTVNGAYYNFYGVSGAVPNSSATVRALPGRSFSKSFTVNIGANDTVITIAYPATLPDLVNDSVRYVEGLNSPIGSLFAKANFNVQDAGGNNVSYKVFTQTLGTGYGALSTYTVNIP